MANSLLDFVMSLVRDPDAAARYAANPDQAIADANLVDVTSADVQNLIPVVSESVSMSAPLHAMADPSGLDPAVVDPVDVWTSGAATAAFDAFDPFGDGLPTPLIVDTEPDTALIVDRSDAAMEAPVSSWDAEPVLSPLLDDPIVDQVAPPVDDVLDDLTVDAIHPAAVAQPDENGSAFDLFD